jgi:hypothetical protein
MTAKRLLTAEAVEAAYLENPLIREFGVPGRSSSRTG